MANLKGKLSQYGDAVVLTQAYSYFNLLNKKLSEVKSQSLNLKQSKNKLKMVQKMAIEKTFLLK